MSKANPCGKTTSVDKPYEIWTMDHMNFEWRVLKKYQTPENEAKNPYARWYCAVKSDMTYDMWEYGDVYVSEIKQNGVKLIYGSPFVELQLLAVTSYTISDLCIKTRIDHTPVDDKQ
mgnify:CR=1 FL=1